MATASPFNTLEYVRELKEADVPEKQAEAEARALWNVLEARDKAIAEQAQALAAVQEQLKKQEKDAEKMATKGDLRELKTELNGRMDNLELGLRKDMEALGNKLIIRLTLAMVGVVGVAVTIAGLLLRASLLK